MRLVDDPALPERLLANRKRSSFVVAAVLPIVLLIAPRHAFWSIPLLIVARMAAAYPLRKTLYSESWSIFGYLSFFLRLIVAGYGLWLLLAFLPAFTMMAGRYDWLAAIVLAAVLLLWNARAALVLRRLLRATPIVDEWLVSRFDDLCRTCALPTVTLERVD